MMWLRVVFAIKAFVSASASICDTTIKTVHEGNVGETRIFPWLGVLRVHLHEGDSYKVALTGLVLVQEGYAIANADDVARIPKRVFKEDSRGMFIPREGEPWYCALVDYMTHPEYEYATMNTIALIELDPGKNNRFPMYPICWPPYTYNFTRDLHAIAFTDDNKLLEKSIYTLKTVSSTRCDQFYKKAGLMEKTLMPTHYLCGVATHNTENCIWDNGIVMASNTTGNWALVGFGIRGPGCASPARFINIIPYFAWIESVTNFQDGDKDPSFRRSAFNEGFKNKLRYRESTMEATYPDLSLSTHTKYIFDTEAAQDLYFSIDRISDTAIAIKNVDLPAREGECSNDTKRLIYHDTTKVYAEDKGFVSYRLSMFDMMAFNYTCVIISIEPRTCNDKAILYWMKTIENTEGHSIREYGGTPETILKINPLHKIQLRPNPNDDLANWEPGAHLKADMLSDDDTPIINIKNYNIYFKFAFEDYAYLSVDIYGPFKPPHVHPTTTTTRTTREWLRARLQDSEEEELEDIETIDPEPDKEITTPKAKSEMLEPLPIVREPTPTSQNLLKGTTLFSAGEMSGSLSLKLITIQVFAVLYLC